MLVVLYTIIVVVAGLKGVIPSVLAPIQDFLWYLAAVGMVATVLVAGMSFMLSGNSDTSTKKPKKVKKPKKQKVKKEKKPKKEKPPKEKKPKKEKKKKEKKKKK